MTHELPEVLAAIERGDSASADRLLPLVYDELRSLAAARLAREPAGQTLQATALVHEAYLKLSKRQDRDERAVDGAQQFRGRAHFFAAAADAMRRILVDRARARETVKRGRDQRRLELTPDRLFEPEASAELVELDEALESLARIDPTKARLVTMRFFGGLTQQQAAEVLGISTSSADRLWASARVWLFQAIQKDG